MIVMVTILTILIVFFDNIIRFFIFKNFVFNDFYIVEKHFNPIFSTERTAIGSIWHLLKLVWKLESYKSWQRYIMRDLLIPLVNAIQEFLVLQWLNKIKGNAKIVIHLLLF